MRLFTLLDSIKRYLHTRLIQSHEITAVLYRNSFDQALQYPDPLYLQRMKKNGYVDSRQLRSQRIASPVCEDRKSPSVILRQKSILGSLKGSECSVQSLSIMYPALILPVDVYRVQCKYIGHGLFCLFWFSLFGNGANPGGDGDADWSS